MKILREMQTFRATSPIRRAAGFTLIEFLVAMVLFLIIGGTTFSMFAKNAIGIAMFLLLALTPPRIAAQKNPQRQHSDEPSCWPSQNIGA